MYVILKIPYEKEGNRAQGQLNSLEVQVDNRSIELNFGRSRSIGNSLML